MYKYKVMKTNIVNVFNYMLTSMFEAQNIKRCDKLVPIATYIVFYYVSDAFCP